MFISRIAKDKRKQSTIEHLKGAAELASKWAKLIGFEQTAFLTALLHDMGKYSKAFITYLCEQNKNKRGSVIHSTQGARYIYEVAVQRDNLSVFIAEIVGLCVAGHHGVLMDGLSPDGETPFLERILTQDISKLHFDEVKKEFKNRCLLTDLEASLEASKKELQQFIEKCKWFIEKRNNQNLNIAFMIHMLTKFLFSCLVDADRYNAYCFETKTEPVFTKPPWDRFLSRLEVFLADKNKKSDKPIDRIRREISDKCRIAANRPLGIYQLEIPTGGGKTLSSLRFALEHAQKHDMERIIYFIPYLSVLEQTANSIREALGLSADDPSILEHHSNIIPPEDMEKAQEDKLLTERWDASIVITTSVQFLESVFSEKASKLRKFHNMTNAVLIFDEVQSLPVKCIHLFNDAVNFLSMFGKSTVLLCTATQPPFDCVERRICLSNTPNLTSNMENEFNLLSRTRIVADRIMEPYTNEALADFVLEKHRDNGNCLVILNTKRTVTDLFITIKKRLKNSGQPIKLYHLSTLMCPEHRMDVIEKVKYEIEREPLICISSQLIEAGVDISFRCVIRACAGLDSIAQAAGRCNRHGEDPNGRDVYIVNLADENLSRLPDIRIGAEITARIIDEKKYTNLLGKQALQRYYNEYFYRRAGEMDYQIREDFNLYDLLSVNNKGSLAYRDRPHYGTKPPQFRQALQTAGENFCVIEKNATGVLVPYGKGSALAEEYRHAELFEKANLLRKMSRYSVSLYQYQIEKLSGANALSCLDNDLLLLDKEFYYDERGVVMESDMQFLNY